jgi:hypothetical protein
VIFFVAQSVNKGALPDVGKKIINKKQEVVISC